MVTFLAFTVTAIVLALLDRHLAAWTTCGIGGMVFGVLVVRHGRIERARVRLHLWIDRQQQHRARHELDWSQLDEDHSPGVDANHPFAFDLNVVGPRSLARLLDVAVASGGRARLRAWLLAESVEPEVVRRRQARVQALAPRRHLRDRLAVGAREALGARAKSWDTGALLAWVGADRHEIALRRGVIVLGVMAMVDLGLIAGSVFAGWAPWWGFGLLLYFGGYVVLLRQLADLGDESSSLEEMLTPLCAVFAELRRWRLDPVLEEVAAPLRARDAHDPLAALRRVRRIAWAASLRTNQMLWLGVNALVPWDVWFALRLEDARAALRDDLPRWLDAWHELEALMCLADFAQRESGTCVPEIVDDGSSVFEAEALGHPLLRADHRVRNDLSSVGDGRVVLLSGSNMSGKSTFLRTVGVAAVLANAGSMVLARSLRTSPWRVSTCVQVSDSVNDGISYFYAEVRRLATLLRSLARADARWPQLSLVDEIYRGTNDRERWLGSRAFVEHLTLARGLAVLTTHDLRLTELERERSTLRNLHFREEIAAGRMVFDYRLHEGPCPTTNALRLMELEGLPVPSAAEPSHGSSDA